MTLPGVRARGAWSAGVILLVVYLATLVVIGVSLAADWQGPIGSAVASLIVVLAVTAFYLLTRRCLRERDAALASIEASQAELEHRVLERTAELSQFSRHLLQVRENEKKSIARDLHDELGAYLTAINMDVSRVRDKLQPSHADQAAKLDRTLGLLGSAIEIKRRLISDLRPSILDNLGLGAALEQYIDEWSRHTGILATFDQDGDLESDQEGCGIAIFRVFQEALNNVARHSGATTVRCRIRRVDDTVDFEIVDNGTGPSEASIGKPGTHGLIGMRERILAYRGQLEFTRAPEGGAVVRGTLSCAGSTDPALEHEDDAAVI